MPRAGEGGKVWEQLEAPPTWLTAHSSPRTTIWTHRVRFLEERVLPHWAAFTIWNAGRQGRRLYRSLTPEARRKVGPHPPLPPSSHPAALTPVPEAGVLCPPQVVAFCDVDEKKIRKGFYCYEDSQVWGPRAPGRASVPHGLPTPPLALSRGTRSSPCPEPSSLGKASCA